MLECNNECHGVGNIGLIARIEFWILEANGQGISRVSSEAYLLGMPVAIFSFCLHVLFPVWALTFF